MHAILNRACATPVMLPAVYMTSRDEQPPREFRLTSLHYS